MTKGLKDKRTKKQQIKSFLWSVLLHLGMCTFLLIFAYVGVRGGHQTPWALFPIPPWLMPLLLAAIRDQFPAWQVCRQKTSTLLVHESWPMIPLLLSAIMDPFPVLQICRQNKNTSLVNESWPMMPLLLAAIMDPFPAWKVCRQKTNNSLLVIHTWDLSTALHGRNNQTK